MTARDVQKILGARVLVGEEFLDREITSACASDKNSEVFGRKLQRAFWKTLLRLEENASAFEFKCTCVLSMSFKLL